MKKLKVLSIVMGVVLISGTFNLMADSAKPRVAEIASWEKFFVVLHVNLGEKVKKGQLLFENNHDMLNIEKSFIKEKVKFYELVSQRAEKVFKDHVISENLYLKIQDDLSVVTNELKLIDTKLDMQKYYAPFDGTVTHIEAYDGTVFWDCDTFMIVTEGDVNVDTKNRKTFVANRWEENKIITHVAVGEKVKKGQLLFNVDFKAYNIQKAICQSQYDYLKKVFEMNDKLIKTKSVSEIVHYKSFLDYMKAKRDLEIIKLKIKQSYGYAPFDAEITEVIRYTGSGIGDGKPVVNIRALE